MAILAQDLSSSGLEAKTGRNIGQVLSQNGHGAQMVELGAWPPRHKMRFPALYASIFAGMGNSVDKLGWVGGLGGWVVM